MISFDPTEDMKDQAVRYALSQCADVTRIKAPRVVIYPAEEACGVFFYPDRRFALGYERPTVGRFVPLPNVWEPAEQRHIRYAFDYDALEAGVIREYGGLPSGFVQLWHSHLTSEPPSEADHAAVDVLAEGLRGHPLWAPAEYHLVLCVSDDLWWRYAGSVHAGNAMAMAAMSQ